LLPNIVLNNNFFQIARRISSIWNAYYFFDPNKVAASAKNDIVAGIFVSSILIEILLSDLSA